jgi:phage gp45-like
MSQDTDALWREIAALRREIQRTGKQEAAHVADFIPITATSVDGASDAVATVAPFPDQRRTAGQQTVQRIEPWGLRSRALVNNLYGLVVRVLGGGSNPALVGLSAPGYGPDDLEAGETALYCMADGTVVKLTKVGKIEIDAAGGQDIVFNGGTARVSRVGDATAGHLHAAGTLMCPNTGTGNPVAITGSTASATDTMAEGAANVKA